MEQNGFRIKERGIKAFQKKSVIRSTLLATLAGAVGIFIAAYNTTGKNEGDYTHLYFVVPLLAIFFFIGIRSGIKRQRDLLESYLLTIGENSIRREQHNTPVIHIYKNEITDVVKSKSCYYIKSREAANLIMIPLQIERSEELETMLNEIMPISTKRDVKLTQLYSIAVALTFLGLMAIFFTSMNKVVVAISGILLGAGIAYLLKEGWQSKSIDKRTKRGLLWLVLILSAVVVKVIAVLFIVEQ